MSDTDTENLPNLFAVPFHTDTDSGFSDPVAEAYVEHKELIIAATELAGLADRLNRIASFYQNVAALKNFELHSKEYRQQELERLIELVDAVEDSGKGFYKKLKRVKRGKPTPEIVDRLLNTSINKYW